MDPFGQNAVDSDEEFEVNIEGANIRDNDNPPWLLTPDWYRAKVMSVVKSTSKENNPMYVWEFAVEGDTVRYYTSLVPSAIGFLSGVLDSLGVERDGDTYKFKRADVIGNECDVFIDNEDYNDTKVNRITLFDLAGSRCAPAAEAPKDDIAF